MGRYATVNAPVPQEKRPVGRPPRKTKAEKNPEGRPPKGTIVVKPVVCHDMKRIAPHNRERYAMDAIKNAEKIYKKYNEPRPNPLNIDEKDLTPEAKECWKYIFHLRNYEPQECMICGGQPITRTFRTGDEVVFAFECFCTYIRAKNFMTEFIRPDGEVAMRPIVPNHTSFARWLGVSALTVSETMKNHSTEDNLNTYRNMLADILSEGGMIGAYNNSMTIFTLKNLCDWADKYEDRPKRGEDTTQTVEEAQKLMADLGYGRNLIGQSTSGNADD